MKAAVSAYVPCFNNEATVLASLDSLRAQSVPPTEICLLDDGSTDRSVDVGVRAGVRVVRMERNSGRGAVRARAMKELQHEFVACCDATNTLAPDFVERSLRWMDDPQVAGVFGRITQQPPRCLSDRWRGRHLFKVNEPMTLKHGGLLSTWGCLLRRSAVLDVGNFDSRLRHSEDAELGRRLLAKNYDVVFDPELKVVAGVTNTLGQVMERYWRWYAGVEERVSWRQYFKQVAYAAKVMARQDLRDGDLWSVPVSLFTPHYQFWKSWTRRSSASAQRT